jgi:transcription initiation factor TFIID subunit 5
MSDVSAELLLMFLYDANFSLLLAIINRHIFLRRLKGAPNTATATVSSETASGLGIDAGLSADDPFGPSAHVYFGPYFREHVDARCEIAADAASAKAEEAGLDAVQVEEAGAAARAAKRRELVALARKSRALQHSAYLEADVESSEYGPLAPSPFGMPEELPTKLAQDLEDARAAIALGPDALPSVCLFTLLHSVENVNCLAIGARRGFVAAGCADSIVRVWDVAQSKANTADVSVFFELVGHAGPVFAVDFSPTSDEMLLSSSEDGSVRLWSVLDRAPMVVYRASSSPVWDVRWAPNGYMFAAASADSCAHVFVTDQIHPVRMLAGHMSDVNAVAWHPNGAYVVTGSHDETVRVYDVTSGRCVRLLVGAQGPISALSVCPDGSTVAAGDTSGVVSLFDLPTAMLRASLMGHRRPVWSLSWSRRATMLASGGHDCTVRLWDARSALTNEKRANVLHAYPTVAAQVAADEAAEAAAARAGGGDGDGEQATGTTVTTPASGPATTSTDAVEPPTATPSTKASSSSSSSKATTTVQTTTPGRPSPHLLKTLFTKRTPVFAVLFAPRNTLLAAGGFIPSQ